MKIYRTITISAVAALPLLGSLATSAYAQREQRMDPDPNVRLEMSRDQYRFKKQAGEKTPRLFAGQGITQGNDVFDCTGQYVGSDPDPVVRARILEANTSDACK